MKRMAECNRLYTQPSYHNLQHILLEEEKTNLVAKLHNRTEDSVQKFGATLSIEGWNSIINRPLIKALLVSSMGEQFFRLVDISGVKKNAAYALDVLEKFIE